MKGISRSGSLGMLPPPLWAGQSHVEILDSNRACESAAGFQSCAHDPISIPMLRPFAENWPHAIALPPQGGGERTECAALFCINHLDFAHANCAAPIGVSFGSIRRGR